MYQDDNSENHVRHSANTAIKLVDNKIYDDKWNDSNNQIQYTDGCDSVPKHNYRNESIIVE